MSERRDPMLTEHRPIRETVREEKITPEYAQWVLDGYNPQNRAFKNRLIDIMAKNMVEGQWFTHTGEFIKFDEDGQLADGQNRLRAVVVAGIPVWIPVIRGLPAKARHYIDQGIKRSGADTLKMLGVKHNHKVHAAMLRVIDAFESGWLTSASQKASRYVITNDDVCQLHEQHAGASYFVSWVSSNHKEFPIPGGVLAAAYYLMAEKDYDAAQAFWEDIVNRTTRGKGDPRLAMMKACARIKDSVETEFAGAYLCVVFQAWNLWRVGQTASSISYKTGDPEDPYLDIPEPI